MSAMSANPRYTPEKLYAACKTYGPGQIPQEVKETRLHLCQDMKKAEAGGFLGNHVLPDGINTDMITQLGDNSSAQSVISAMDKLLCPTFLIESAASDARRMATGQSPQQEFTGRLVANFIEDLTAVADGTFGTNDPFADFRTSTLGFKNLNSQLQPKVESKKAQPKAKSRSSSPSRAAAAASSTKVSDREEEERSTTLVQLKAGRNCDLRIGPSVSEAGLLKLGYQFVADCRKIVEFGDNFRACDAVLLRRLDMGTKEFRPLVSEVKETIQWIKSLNGKGDIKLETALTAANLVGDNELHPFPQELLTDSSCYKDNSTAWTGGKILDLLRHWGAWSLVYEKLRSLSCDTSADRFAISFQLSAFLIHLKETVAFSWRQTKDNPLLATARQAICTFKNLKPQDLRGFAVNGCWCQCSMDLLFDDDDPAADATSSSASSTHITVKDAKDMIVTAVQAMGNNLKRTGNAHASGNTSKSGKKSSTQHVAPKLSKVDQDFVDDFVHHTHGCVGCGQDDCPGEKRLYKCPVYSREFQSYKKRRIDAKDWPAKGKDFDRENEIRNAVLRKL